MTLQFLQNARVNVDESGAIAISSDAPLTVSITEPLEVEGTVNATPVQSSGASVQLTATIANGAAVSGSVAIAGARGVAVQVPSAWTAADIGFDVSEDGSTWLPVKRLATYIRITNVPTGAAQLLPAPAELWAAGAYAFIRLVSLTVGLETTVNQGAARTLKVIYLS